MGFYQFGPTREPESNSTPTNMSREGFQILTEILVLTLAIEGPPLSCLQGSALVWSSPPCAKCDTLEGYIG